MKSVSRSVRRAAAFVLLLSLLTASTAGAAQRNGRRERDFFGKIKRFVVAALSELSSPPGKP
jgi:hypothetical protein